MDDDSGRSSEATQLEEDSKAEETKHLHDDAEDFRTVSDDDDDDNDEETDDQRDGSALEVSPMSAEEDSRTCQSLTLVSDLSEVPVKYEMRRDELEHLKNQLQGSHQEALAIVIAQAAKAHSENQITPGVPSLGSELSTMLVTPLLRPSVSVFSSLPCSNSQGQITSPELNAASTHVVEANQKDASDPKSLSTSCSGKTPIDGYNWRKYGQKQVKNPEGSRSYYKCTYMDCDAKKIESCDQYNSVTRIVYKGQHKHDPPKKELSRGGKIVSTPKALKRKSISTTGSSNSVGGGPIQIEQMDEPQRKLRVNKSSSASPGSVLKPKKPKFVVHAAGDIEISADGYRWRKYGQKMVKGNPHPRNYYKCTSAGCPVRKHIERAVDGTSEVMITYKGVHDHDMPVPKKRQGPPSGLLITAAKNVSRSKRSAPLAAHGSTTEPPNGVGEKKTSEPARTLLSVGFEIKHC